MIAEVFEQDNQRLVLYIKGGRKSPKFVLQIGISIILVLFILLKLIGINWLVATLIAIGGALPFIIVLAALFLKVYEPNRYFIFDKGWNLFKGMKYALNEQGKTSVEAPLSSLIKMEGVYSEEQDNEMLLLEFKLDGEGKRQVVLYSAPGKDSLLSDKEHIRLFLQG